MKPNFDDLLRSGRLKIVDFTGRVLGEEYGDLVRRFKRMRRKCHPLQYEASFVESEEEVSKAIKDARDLLSRIQEHIGLKPPQTSLY